SIPPLALLLVVASSLGWAGFDLLRKLLVREVPSVALVFLLTAASAPLFAVWMVVDGATRMEPGYLLPALGSVALNVAANLLFLEGMRIAPLSVTVPLLSLTPVFTTLLAIPLLGERPSLRGVMGILLVIAGAIWLNWQPREGRSPEDRRGKLKGAVMVALTSLFWSLTIPLDKLAVELSTPQLHGLTLNAGVAASVLVVLVAQRRMGDLATLRKVPGVFGMALVVSVVALAL
ncbi:MAG TPA: DMT family transporter, partial [Thermoanaerobaculia bacterium]|nr:DMT family transporter [Thermoanaerobaculia bacterium]